MRRRGWLALLATLGIVLAVVATLWLVWLPSYRPALKAGERYGVDVSHHQGPIDWGRVAADHISFAYIKASQGVDFTDDRFAENWQGAGAARLDRGAYHFFSLCASGAAQAQHFLTVLPADAGELPEALDLELAGNCDARPYVATVTRELDVFLTTVESATGRPVVLYVGANFATRYPVTTGRPRWVLRFLRRPSGDVAWAVWQVSGFAHVDGVDGRVDLDVGRANEPS